MTSRPTVPTELATQGRGATIVEYPREVTALSGQQRWQGADGRTYDTYEEAANAELRVSNDDGTTTTPVESPVGPSWVAAFLQVGLGLFTAIFGPYALFTGEVHLKYEWLELFLLLGWFILLGVGIQGARDLYILLTKQSVSTDYKPDAVLNWWVGKVGGNLLLLAVGLCVLALGWYFLHDLLDGMSKGTIIIIILLFLILEALEKRR